jgi:hypothetical protein
MIITYYLHFMTTGLLHKGAVVGYQLLPDKPTKYFAGSSMIYINRVHKQSKQVTGWQKILMLFTKCLYMIWKSECGVQLVLGK